MEYSQVTGTHPGPPFTPLNIGSLWYMLVAHLYVGVPIVIVYIALAPYAISLGFPSLVVLLLCEVTIMPLLILGHLYSKGYRRNGRASLNGVVRWGNSIGVKRFVLLLLGCVLLTIALYAPAYLAGTVLRDTLFNWLPDWYFNPGFEQAAPRLLLFTVVLAIISDGIVAPILEELYFRGYLLPNMSALGWLAPLVNAALFTLYHFWQPHNYLGIFAVSLVISFAVWKTGSLRLGIAIHCSLNLLSSIGLLGYLSF